MDSATKKHSKTKTESNKFRKSKELVQEKAITKTKLKRKQASKATLKTCSATPQSKPEQSSSKTTSSKDGVNRLRQLQDVEMPNKDDISADQLNENQKNVVKRSCQSLFGHHHVPNAEKQSNLKLKGATNQLQDLMQLIANKKKSKNNK